MNFSRIAIAQSRIYISTIRMARIFRERMPHSCIYHIVFATEQLDFAKVDTVTLRSNISWNVVDGDVFLRMHIFMDASARRKHGDVMSSPTSIDISFLDLFAPKSLIYFVLCIVVPT